MIVAISFYVPFLFFLRGLGVCGDEKQMFGVEEDGQGRYGCTDVCFLTFEAATLMARLVDGKAPIIPADIGSGEKCPHGDRDPVHKHPLPPRASSDSV